MTTLVRTRVRYIDETQRVENAAERQQLRVLYKTGGYGRTTMKRSIRPAGKKGRKSRPGEPPRNHVGARNGLRLIQFNVNKGKKSVSVGPIGFRRTNRSYPDAFGNKVSSQTTGQTIPELLDRGGSQVFRIEYPSGVTRFDSARYLPRPFVAPAFQKGVDFFAKELRQTGLR